MKIEKALTFDDILLTPRYSEILPADINLATVFSKNISLQVPFVSAAMDTVTEAPMAIAMALAGGIGVVHRNLSPQEQAKEVAIVKTILGGSKYPLATKDENGKLRVAAAVGPASNMQERIELLANAGVDALVVDTAHGHSKGVIDTIRYIKNSKSYKHIDVIAGNIATSEAAIDLIEVNADALKVGIGPGSICTTRIIAGTGVPQLTAIINVVSVAHKYKVPVIADGGIKYSGDAAKALAIGASSVMMGSILAGAEEAPGETFYAEDGKVYKNYRGMGSLGAMSMGGKERYGQANVARDKFVPEGIEGQTLYKGPVTKELHQLAGGIRSAMGYSGAKDLKDFKKKAKLVQITPAGLRESHPHDVIISKAAPNYKT